MSRKLDNHNVSYIILLPGVWSFQVLILCLRTLKQKKRWLATWRDLYEHFASFNVPLSASSKFLILNCSSVLCNLLCFSVLMKYFKMLELYSSQYFRFTCFCGGSVYILKSDTSSRLPSSIIPVFRAFYMLWLDISEWVHFHSSSMGYLCVFHPSWAIPLYFPKYCFHSDEIDKIFDWSVWQFCGSLTWKQWSIISYMANTSGKMTRE